MNQEQIQLMDKPSKTGPALIGGAVAGIISATPFLNLINCICCAGIMVGGFLAVYIYKDQLTPEAPLQASDGVALGALAGVFGFLAALLIELLIFSLFGNIGQEAMMNMMARIFETFGIELPSEYYDQAVAARETSPLQPMSLVIGSIVTILFSIIGGLIGSVVYRPKEKMIQE